MGFAVMYDDRGIATDAGRAAYEGLLEGRVLGSNRSADGPGSGGEGQVRQRRGASDDNTGLYEGATSQFHVHSTMN